MPDPTDRPGPSGDEPTQDTAATHRSAEGTSRPEDSPDPGSETGEIEQLRLLKHGVVNLRVAVEAYTLKLSQHTVAIADLHRRRVRTLVGLYVVVVALIWSGAFYVEHCAAARYGDFLIERGIYIEPAGWCGYVVPVIAHRFGLTWPTVSNLAGLAVYAALGLLLAGWWWRSHRHVQRVAQHETDTAPSRARQE